MSRPKIRVEGLKEVQKLLRNAKDKDLDKLMRTTNREVARIVVDDARPFVPVRTGALAASLNVVNSTRNAIVKMGTPSKVPYAGPIHYGWAARNIKPQPAISVGIVKKRSEIEERYETGVDELLRAIESKGTSPT